MLNYFFMSFSSPQDNGSKAIVDGQKESAERLIASIEKLDVSINKLDETTAFYSKRLLLLTVAMVMIVIIQIFFSIILSNANLQQKVIYMVSAGIIIAYLLREAFKEIEKDKK